MPAIVSMRGIRNGLTKEWEYLDHINYPCAVLWHIFRVIYAFTSDQKLIDLSVLKAGHTGFSGTAQQLIDAFPAEVVLSPIVDTPPLRRGTYMPASSLGYCAAACTQAGEYSVNQARPDFDHLRLASYAFESIYGQEAANLAYRKQLCLVNGLLHPVFRVEKDLVILDGNKTVLKSKQEQLGIIILPDKCYASYHAYPADMVLPPYAGVLFSVAGYLFSADSPGVSIAQNGTLQMDFRRMDMAKKLYEASSIIDLSSLSFDPLALADAYTFTQQDIAEVLALKQSFVIALTDRVTILEQAVKLEGRDGCSFSLPISDYYGTPTLRALPLKWGAGRLVDWFSDPYAYAARGAVSPQSFLDELYLPKLNKPSNPVRYYGASFIELVTGFPT